MTVVDPETGQERIEETGNQTFISPELHEKVGILEQAVVEQI